MNKILVVDDDIDILTVVQLVLDSNGFEVEAISNWKHIFTRIDTFKPDLILLDVSLGNQDGRNICKQLKSSEESKNIPVILFSANHNVQNSIAECGANSFIEKPFDLKNLIERINNQLLKPNGFN